MKHTEAEILAKGKIVLKDIQGEYYNEKYIEGIRFHQEAPISLPDERVVPVWIIYVREPLFDSSVFLMISDDTAEPLCIRSKYSTVTLTKNTEGVYCVKFPEGPK